MKFHFGLLSKIQIGIFFYLSGMTPGIAYQLNWEDLWHQMLQKNQKWTQVILKTTVIVFDPFSKEETLPSDQNLKELPELGYQQTIYWKMDDLLVIETYDRKGDLLHFYYESKGDVVNVATQDKRIFSKMDLLPHYLRFVVRRAKDWENVLAEVNIQENEISLYHDKTFTIFYRVGESQTGGFALIDKQNFFLKSLQFNIRTGEQEHPIRIVFEKMTAYEHLGYPQQTDYFIDNQLFKQVRIDALQQPEELPLETLREKAKKWQIPRFVSSQIDYTR